MTTCYSQIPSGDCQEEAGFETGERRDGEDFGRVYVLMADGNEVQELREQLYQAKRVVKGGEGCAGLVD